MHCPFCRHSHTRVIDSRISEDGNTIRRRRACEECGERFSTQETVEIRMPIIIKGDGRREGFDAGKLRISFSRALHKRPVPEASVEAAVRKVTSQLRMSGDREISSHQVGQYVMDQLHQLDHVAYVRFASVYRSFKDVADFRTEIDRLEHSDSPAEALPQDHLSSSVSHFNSTL